MKNQQQIQWTKLRYDYYISGRRLFFDGLFTSGILLLSYAIEVGFKALITEYIKSNEEQKAYKTCKNSHDLLKLKMFMNSLGIGENITVSDDFLKYITLNFNRYPKHIADSQSKWSSEIGSMTIGINYLVYFDNLIIQINEEIIRKTNNIDCDIISKALIGIENIESRIFFHQNIHAKKYIDLSLKEMAVQKKSIARISKILSEEDIMFYKEFEVYLPLGLQNENLILDQSNAKNFKLPNKEDNTWIN